MRLSAIILNIVAIILVSIPVLFFLYGYKQDYDDRYEINPLFELTSPDMDYTLSVANEYIHPCGAPYGRVDEMSINDNSGNRIAVIYYASKITPFDENSVDVQWNEDDVTVHVIGDDYSWRVKYSDAEGRDLKASVLPRVFLIYVHISGVALILALVCLLFVNRFRACCFSILFLALISISIYPFFSRRIVKSVENTDVHAIYDITEDVSITNCNIRGAAGYYDRVGIHWINRGNEISVCTGVRGKITDTSIKSECENDSLIITFSGDDHFTIELIRQ